MEIAWLEGGSIVSPQGFKAGAVHAGIKTLSKTEDVVLVASEVPCVVAGLFTQNKVKAAPVQLDMTRLRYWNGKPGVRGLVVNSGNANACTGRKGAEDAEEMTRLAAAKIGCDPDAVLVSSTGVIGVHLPVQKIRTGIEEITLGSDAENGAAAARGIMTTDMWPKHAGAQVRLHDGTTITIGGMSKGAGMIHPNMATMLAYLNTDAALDPTWMRLTLKAVTDASFNAITVDGDSSTNDTVLLFANGMAMQNKAPINANHPDAKAVAAALGRVAMYLAREIVRNGEGVTKVMEVQVTGAAGDQDARIIARTIASSNLVKCAIYGSDPNWGRIVCAAGRAGGELELDKVNLRIGDIALMENGQPLPFDAKQASALLSQKEIVITMDLGLGSGSGHAWGSDLTEEYVKFNSDYTT